ncbi:MAG TPA: CAP domain-containing protein [Mucilaginibacter sp.]|nr:CAP domain-containing protein [Mucilaginibacter sp.]
MKLLSISLIVFSVFFAGMAVKPDHPPKKDFKKEFLARINKARHEGCHCGDVYMAPAPPMVWNNDLENAAQNHAEDMSAQKYFSHTSKDGRTMSDRVIAVGYTYKGYKSFAVGENIAEGQESIAEVMDGWLKSPGHCKNLMNPSFKEVGIAYFNKYWVQDFGGREPFSAKEEKLLKSGRYKLIEQHP